MTPIIEVHKLSKSFPIREKRRWFGAHRAAPKPDARDRQSNHSYKTALHPISFDVKPGETIAFIGPNGAGKSTTIKILTGILHPSSGDASVLGLRPWEQRIALSYQIGTVFGQKSQLWYHLPPEDTFQLTGRIYDLPTSVLQSRTKDLVNRFQLGPYMRTPVRKLSLGERMRCEIALSFLHRPKILFLDEPTIGLDVVVKQTVRQLIHELNEQEGVTVFLTSHDPTDVEALCQRVIVIHDGRFLFDGPTAELVKQFLHYKEIRLQLRTQDHAMVHELATDGVEVTANAFGRVSIVVDLSKHRIERLLQSVLQRCDVHDISVIEPSMEDIIRAIYSPPKGGNSV